ncbi:hypothetical protein D0469_14680 [Peribacillus saganii]|uniref:YhfM-like domain-containing protein n=1 Tax=Peribacillus saganii TaxID=2303992 RepID=A0A372LL34_9BACI|nr:hypothetical protein [Peribacillus saganii]RFU67493.1 hypothetical protein D0469_14680 [Peribacillus saganii]
MKIQTLFIALVAVFLFAVTGCSSGIENEEQKIVVQQRNNDNNADKYQDFREITDSEQVQKAKKILDEAEWNNSKVNMSRPADYQFFFHYKNEKIKADTIQHLIWISPNKDKLEVVRGNDEYVQLTEDNSEILFEIITGEDLTSLK